MSDYSMSDLVGFLQEIAARKEVIELQLDLYGGDDPSVEELRDQLQERLDRLQEKEDRINERVEAMMSAYDGGMPE